MQQEQSQKVGVVGYIMLIFGIMCFSGVLGGVSGAWAPLKAIDFNALAGSFGKISGTSTFQGVGGTGARGGFMFALSLFPSVILALGIVRIIDGYGGLAAAQKLITPLFRPLFNIPGICGLAFITSLQSTDCGAGMTKELFDDGKITDHERTIFTTMQLSCPSTITNFFSIYAALFPLFVLIGMPIALPIGIALICKCIAGINMRILLALLPKDPQDNDKTPQASA